MTLISAWIQFMALIKYEERGWPASLLLRSVLMVPNQRLVRQVADDPDNGSDIVTIGVAVTPIRINTWFQCSRYPNRFPTSPSLAEQRSLVAFMLVRARLQAKTGFSWRCCSKASTLIVFFLQGSNRGSGNCRDSFDVHCAY